MGIVDVIIILLLGLGAVLGFKKGFIKTTAMFIGFILVLVLAYFLKNPVAMLLYENFPFITFKGFFKGVTVLNILVYEGLAFILVLTVLMILLKVLSFLTGFIEKILKATIILGIPSKILGAVVGLIQAYIIIFVAVFFLKQPVFDFEMVNDSDYATIIVEKTPLLKSVADDSIVVFNEIYTLKDKYETVEDVNQMNLESLDILLKYEVITVKSVDTLIEKDKLKIDGIDAIVDKYR